MLRCASGATTTNKGSTMRMSETHVSPANRLPRPADTEEDRIRAAFALSNDAPLPKVSKETLLQYHEYLTQQLSFPFQALYAETTPPVRQIVRYVTVIGLSDSVRRRMYGLFCKVQIENAVVELPLADLGIHDNEPNRQLIDDYLHWLWSGN
jgi:hypothetical protein